MKKALKTAPRGTAFNYAGQRWVVLEHNATGTLCLTEKIVEDRAFDDGNCNDFSKSSSLRYLNGPFLDTLIDAAGCSSAFLTSELDLTADDGLKDYGTCTVTIFLLTVDQYILEKKVDSGTWTQIYKGSARTYSVAVTYGSTSIQFRVKAYDTAGAESAYTTSASRTVINNRAPVISGSDGDLGNFSSAAPTHEYVVTDADGHQVDVVESLDGVAIKSYTVTLGQTNTLSLTSDQWLKLTNGQHTLTIKATDAKDASVVRTLTFTKAVTSVEFVQPVAMTADAMPTKALVNIQGNFPAGCTLQVWICNNGNDASPTWEDITTKALNSQKHFFTNTTKTASDWGVKVKVKLLHGSATETCYIQSIGGNFA